MTKILGMERKTAFWVLGGGAAVVVVVIIMRRRAQAAAAAEEQPTSEAAPEFGGVSGGGGGAEGGGATDQIDTQLQNAQIRQEAEAARHEEAMNKLAEAGQKQEQEFAGQEQAQKIAAGNVELQKSTFGEQRAEAISTATQPEEIAAKKAALREQEREQKIGQHCPGGYKPSFDASGTMTCQKKSKKWYARVAEPILNAAGQAGAGYVEALGASQSGRVNPYKSHNEASSV